MSSENTKCSSWKCYFCGADGGPVESVDPDPKLVFICDECTNEFPLEIKKSFEDKKYTLSGSDLDEDNSVHGSKEVTPHDNTELQEAEVEGSSSGESEYEEYEFESDCDEGEFDIYEHFGIPVNVLRWQREGMLEAAMGSS
jgi:hypothetical protein